MLAGDQWRVACWIIGCFLLSPVLRAEDKVVAPSAETEAKPARAVVFSMAGPLTESPRSNEFSFDIEPKRSLYSVLSRLEQARDDDQVSAVVFTFDQPAIGWAQMQELRLAIKALREAGKDVYCYLEAAGSAAYQMASEATEIVISPVGGVDLRGVLVETAYFKGLMDKIGVEADIEHCGDYKAAGEPFTQTGPSEPAREMIEWLVKDLYDQLVESLASARDKSVDQMRTIIDNGPYTADEALAAGLVDRVMHVEDFADAVRDHYEDDIVFDHHYASETGPELDFTNMFSFFKTFGQMMSKAHQEIDTGAIAVVYVEGMIVDGKSEEELFGDGGNVGGTTIRRIFNRLASDDDYEAVVVRIDSPGGSALASDIMWHSLSELAAVKPVVV